MRVAVTAARPFPARLIGGAFLRMIGAPRGLEGTGRAAGGEAMKRMRVTRWLLAVGCFVLVAAGHADEAVPSIDGGIDTLTHALVAEVSAERIEARVNSEAGCTVRVMESFADGWTATVDGAPTELLAGDGFTLAAWVPPGAHDVAFVYRTPGATAGAVASLLVLLLGAIGLVRLREG